MSTQWGNYKKNDQIKNIIIKCLQLLGLHKRPCSNAQREILSKLIEHDNVPSWFHTTESLESISTA